MDIKHIESFYWAGQLGSFSAAAQYLNTTQPNISARIQALERELGRELFDRSARQIRLTSDGRQLLRLADEVIASLSAMKNFGDGQPELSGRVRLGVTNTIAHTWLPDLITRIQAEHPDVDVDFHVDTNETLKQRLAIHDIDILICTEQIREPGILSEFLFQSSFEWVAPATLVFKSEPVTVEELARHRIITYPSGSAMHDMVLSYFQQSGVTPQRLSGSNSLPSMLELVAVEAGICAIPGVAVAARDSRPAVRRIAAERRLPDIDFFLSHADDRLNRTLPALTSLIRNICQQWLKDHECR